MTDITNKEIENALPQNAQTAWIKFDGFPEVTEESLVQSLMPRWKHWLKSFGKVFKNYRKILDQYPKTQDGVTILPIASTGKAMLAMFKSQETAKATLDRMCKTGCLVRVTSSWNWKRHVAYKYAWNDKAEKIVMGLCRKNRIHVTNFVWTGRVFYV